MIIQRVSLSLSFRVIPNFFSRSPSTWKSNQSGLLNISMSTGVKLTRGLLMLLPIHVTLCRNQLHRVIKATQFHFPKFPINSPTQCTDSNHHQYHRHHMCSLYIVHFGKNTTSTKCPRILHTSFLQTT